MIDYDVIIAGAGMVGGSLALSLAQQGLRVAVLERAPTTAIADHEPARIRVSALSLGSRQLLEKVGVWQRLLPARLAPYQYLSVWEHGVSPLTFSAEEIGHSELGVIMENDHLQWQLLVMMQAQANIDVIAPATLSGVQQTHSDTALVRLSDGRTLTCRLIIAADGARSQVRDWAGIGTTAWDYRQQAMVLTVKVEQGPYDETWQRFTPTGPQAFLPLFGAYASLVWYHQTATIARLSKLTDQQLANEIREQFPDRLPPFSIVERGAFPLTRQHANRYSQGRVLLAGDAAHTINPLAGQGVNIGLQDVAVLADLIPQHDLASAKGIASLAHQYERVRRPANLAMMSAMDTFYLAFSNDRPLWRRTRKLGLQLAGKAQPLRALVGRYACGLN